MNQLISDGGLLQVLRDLVDELDVPPSRYQEAQDRYSAVSSWLNDDPILKDRNPQIFPQGSFALGTVIKPLADQEYDVDAVCRMDYNSNEISQEGLKNVVGDRLKAHGTYRGMLDPVEGHRRCWRLKYSDDSSFHLDILPAIPDDPSQFIDQGVPEEYARHAICITDRETWPDGKFWPQSNPTGYIDWFKGRMRVILEERRQKVAMEKRANVQDVQDFEVRTPLQRVVQLLKRHRDIRYGDDEDRPISVIICTLAALVYSNEPDIEQALINIVPRMRDGIKKQDGVWWVANPVNLSENFADKWKESPRKADLFFEWLESIEVEFELLRTPSGLEKVGEYLTESFGAREAAAVMTKYASRTKSASVSNSSALMIPLDVSIQELTSFNLPQRENPQWPVVDSESVVISTEWRKSGGWKNIKNNGAYVKRGAELRFRARTTVPEPYEVFWQVVNTGKDARTQNDLRGDFFKDDKSAGTLVHEERAAYRGRHWIECFIVKNGVCVANSREFIVNIN